jgi:hypothetical protein
LFFNPSTARACGAIPRYSHSAVAHFEQKFRSPVLVLQRPSSSAMRAWKIRIAFRPRTFKVFASPMMLIANPPPPAVLRQIEQ